MKLEPIAITGIGCRFPGGIHNPATFWQLLSQGIDAITEIPACRWDVQQYYHLDLTQPGKANTRWGGFLPDIDQFDPQFFGIAPREAITMDPQQRLLLEVAWEALTDAGQLPESWRGSQTGVFIGIGTHDYSIRLWQHPVNDPYATTGTGNCIAANRISYLFDLKGPSLAIDTACSSSLVAIHLACQSLWCGESSMALAGGVNVILLPNVTTGFSKGGFMSSRGRCQSFDAAADGYVRSEGAGIIVLKPLAAAEANGDPIYALIRGTAVNQDGFGPGMAAPNPTAQAAVLREAYRRAKIAPAQVQYVEAHGTGTKVGDPIEVEALGQVLSENRTQPCAIGSVKTNIGHTETAAGVAGVIKAALALKHQQIPPSLHFQTPNPQIPFDQLPLQVQTQLTDWNVGKGVRTAGVNSFGFGGTNAHVVMTEAKPKRQPQKQPKAKVDRSRHILTLSAKSKPALQALAQRFEPYLDQANLADLCFTANAKRPHFSHRLAIVAESSFQLQAQLKAAGESLSGSVDQPPQVVFLFTGQGSQSVGMGQELYQHSVFRAALDTCDQILQPVLGRSILPILWQEAELLNQTRYTQPALFAIEYSLAQLWLSWGVKPAAVMGHSIGEYVAATIAGVLSLEAALKLVAARAQLMQELPENGAMMALMTSEDIARAAIAEDQTVSIAAINGPENTVISGAKEALSQIAATLAQQGIKATQLTVSHAFHSPLMQPMLAQFESIAASIQYHSPQIPIVSNVTGTWISEFSADYWSQHIQQPVQFAAGMKTLQAYALFLEIGAKPLLCGMGAACLPQSHYLWLPSLRSGTEWQPMLQSLAQLYMRGLDVDWAEFDRPYKRQVVSLPTYPFQRQRFWWQPDSEGSAIHSSVAAQPNSPWVGQPLVLPDQSATYFQVDLSQPYLADHRIFDRAVFPAAGYIEIVLAAASQLGLTGLSLELTIEQPLLLTSNQQLQLKLTPQNADYQAEIISHTGDYPVQNIVRHAIAHLKTNQSHPVQALDLNPPAQSQALSQSEFYHRLPPHLNYGDCFQAVQQLWHQSGQVLGLVQLPSNCRLHPDSQLHPILLDACLQLISAAIDSSSPVTFLPVGVERLNLYRSAPEQCWCRVTLQPPSSPSQSGFNASLKADLWLIDAAGQPIAEIVGLTLQPTSLQRLQQRFGATHSLDAFYEIDWQLQPQLNDAQPQSEHWLILADRTGVAEQLAKTLSAQGEQTTLVFSSESKRSERTKLKQPNSSRFEINPTQRQDLQTLLSRIDRPQHLVYLWGLDQAFDQSIDAVELLQGQQQSCSGILHLLQAWPHANQPRLWLITQGVQAIGAGSTLQLQQAPIWGLSRVIRLEQPQWHCTCIDLESEANTEISIDLLTQELLGTEAEDQVAYRQGNRYVARLIRQNQLQNQGQDRLQCPDTEAFQLQITEDGRLDQLQLQPVSRQFPAAGEVEIQVRAAGINFRDVMNALGMLRPYLAQQGLTDAIPFGWECAGTIAAVGAGVTDWKVGDAVLAVAASGSLGQFVTVPAAFIVTKPENLSFTAAATVPTTFLTAFYGLDHLAQLKAGDRVLIHAAAGGVGLAAVQLAQQIGAEVFATASPNKWRYLKSIGVKHVFNSRDLNFAEQIAQLTDGQGVDVVLNSLNGDFIPHSLSVLATAGRFVEIGKLGIWDSAQMQQTRSDVAYFPFDLLQVSQQDPSLISAMFATVIERLQQGRLQPLPHVTFPIQQAVDAFRYMAQAKQIGKVVLTLPIPAAIQPDASYLVTGGLGGLGLEVAKWLIDSGATRLTLVGRKAANSTAAATIAKLRQTGATIDVVQADLADSAAVASLLTDRNLRGIIHAAGSLDDGLLDQQTWERFASVMAAKVAGAWNLHRLSQHLPLDFFVCFSSIAAVIGSIGQSNYAAANAFLDTLAHYRRQSGLPGLSIDWGAWADVGMAARLGAEVQQQMRQSGMQLIDATQGIAALDRFIHQDAAQVVMLPIDWAMFQTQLGDRAFPLLNQVMAPKQPEMVSIPATANSQPQFLQTLAQVVPAERAAILQVFLQTQLAQVLGFGTAEAIDSQESFGDLGMDSLMAVEFKNRLEASFGCAIPQTLAFDYPTVTALANYLLQNQLKLEDTATLENTAKWPETTTLEEPAVAEATIKASSSESNQYNQPETNHHHLITNGRTAIRSPSSFSQSAVSQPASTSSLTAQPITTQPAPTQPATAEIPSWQPELEIPVEYYQFDLTSEYQGLRADLERVRQLGNPFFGLHEGIARDTTQINQKQLISYSSYNYLGMSGDPIVSAAAKQAIDTYGTSVSASRVVAGERPIHRLLEQEIAQFLGTEDCIVYIGGHSTNVTTIGHLFDDKDLILYDALSHNSIRQGCDLSKATAIEFPHNDWQTLEYLLQQNRRFYQKVLITIEGVYSTDGDIASLPEMVRLKQKYKTFLLVDEAHSIGVLGRTGRGIGEHFGVAADQVDLWMGTLSKSFASCGGYIAGCKAVVEYLKYTAPGFIYSVGISPANTAAALASLQLLQQEPERVATLQARSQFFLSLAKQQQLNTGDSQDSPVIPIIVGEPQRAVRLTHALFDRGITVQPMVYPSVAYNAARLRFFVSCLHTEAQIRYTVEMIRQELSQL